MADISDVEEALADAVAAALAPDSSGLSAAIGLPVRATRGWPLDTELADDLKARVLNVTVTARPGVSRETTRYPETWKSLSDPVTTVVGEVAGNAVTLSAPSGPLPQQLVGLRLGGAAYVYQTAATDTPTSIAAALAALVPGATAAGPVVTCPSEPTFRVAGYAPLFRELRRQVQSFQVVVWCPDGASRDAACSLVDRAMAGLHFLALSDGTAARIRYEGSYVGDAAEKAGLWRRDLRYRVEYATTETSVAPAMLWGVVATSPDTRTV